jgi:sulfotransferase
MKHLHFCGGLPRTGSTVLMNILQQNPEIFTTATDPFPHILQEQILVKSRYTEAFQAMSCEQADDAVYGMALGATRGWYEGLTKKSVVVSKARQWSGLHHLFPQSKILVTVRDLRDIVESFDRVNSRIKALHTFSDDHTLYASMSEEEKLHYHFKESNAFSSTLRHEIPKYIDLFKQDSSRVKFIRYEDVLRNPQYMLQRIYDFLGLPLYTHDLGNIQQSSMFEHDNAYFREKTDHHTKPSLLPWKEPTRVLSEQFHQRVIKDNSWFYRSFYPEVLK